ncbi:hypothetical protein V6N12_053745 [Hibiscus sabdariffa]|uniref:Uncharacterized protein n=1 Tax=Hibiscus sabdariffa TaxID=183260 RepID=A0ABR2D998_9ROSI
MEGSSAGVRKGAWTEEEDILLKKYIEKHGEGNWHQVSSKAGLNRCRKSCRLRWVNYLNPNIKRGAFEDDEVDLIIRLHNLLGNKWSLIAGRLPGRTANDVKNYYNTHLLKKNVDRSFDPDLRLNPSDPKFNTKVIKPRPQILSKKNFVICSDEYMKINTMAAAESTSTPTSNNFLDENGEIMWWENLMMNEDEVDYHQQQGLTDDIDLSVLGEQTANEKLEAIDEDNCDTLGELYLDDELWNVIDP